MPARPPRQTTRRQGPARQPRQLRGAPTPQIQQPKTSRPSRMIYGRMQPNGRRNWGPPGPLGPYSVAEFSLNMNHIQALNSGNITNKVLLKKLGEILLNYGGPLQNINQWIIDQCVEATLAGIQTGFTKFANTSMRQVPMNTGALREAVIASLYHSVPYTQTGLPAHIQIGVTDPTIQYGPIVNKFKESFIQLRHAHGLQMSGKPVPHYLYYVKASLGDFQAQYGFWHFIIENLKTILLGKTRKMAKGTIIEAVDYRNIPRLIYLYVISRKLFVTGAIP